MIVGAGILRIFYIFITIILVIQPTVGLPDIPYFKGAPVFQPQSPASRDEATRETKSPVFQLGPVSHQSPHTVVHCVLYNTTSCILLQTLRRVVPQTSVVPHIEH